MVGQDEKDMISALDADKIAYKRMPDDAGLHTIKVVGPGAWGTVDWDDVWVRLVEVVPGHQSSRFAGEQREKRGLK